MDRKVLIGTILFVLSLRYIDNSASMAVQWLVAYGGLLVIALLYSFKEFMKNKTWLNGFLALNFIFMIPQIVADLRFIDQYDYVYSYPLIVIRVSILILLFKKDKQF